MTGRSASSRFLQAEREQGSYLCCNFPVNAHSRLQSHDLSEKRTASFLTQPAFISACSLAGVVVVILASLLRQVNNSVKGETMSGY
jgi:hypothetical protein